MAKPRKPQTLADHLAVRFAKAKRLFSTVTVEGTRAIYVTHDISQKGEVLGCYDGKLAELTAELVKTGEIYSYLDEIVVEQGKGEHGRLIPIAGIGTTTPASVSVLANYVLAERGGDDGASPIQFRIPRSITDSLLLRTATRLALPQIRHYFRRPVVDKNFVLRGPGYHADIHTMVHSRDIEPASLGAVPDLSCVALQRLPHHLQRLMADFCFLGDADLVNYLAMLLTGVLSSYFAADGKPIFAFDGNQPGVGKTLAATTAGLLLDGVVPTLNRYVTDQKELEKQIGASLRKSQQSLLIIDNAKTPNGVAINSSVIDSMSTAPLLSFRILGQSSNFERPNDVLWTITMNSTQLTRDLATRSCAIQFAFEGDPTRRSFENRNPHEYALEHRREILGELFGMVDRWTQAGRPMSERPHRLTKWSRIVGGILGANGFPEFLANQHSAVQQFDASADQLTALTEAVMRNANGPFLKLNASQPPAAAMVEQNALTATGWLPFFLLNGIDRERISMAKSERAKATLVGSILTPLVGRSVEVEVNGQPVRATLRTIPGRAKTKTYYIEVSSPEIVAAPIEVEGSKAAVSLPAQQSEEKEQKVVDPDAWVDP